jgi:protein phosphatase
VFTRDDAKSSPLNNVLSSAIGASEALPEITRVEIHERGSVILFCTDGLTKHVTDAEIAEHLATLESAELAARNLLQLALDRGGTDNITLVLGCRRRGSAS